MLTDTAVLTWIEQTALSGAVRQSDWAVMALEAVHLLGLALLGGSAVIVALSTMRHAPPSLSTFVTELRPVALTGLILMALSGALIAWSMPFKYYNNSAFQWKMVLLLGALAAAYRLTRQPTRILALLSLILWLGVGFSGRLIGFL
jgi:hypothetical protein